MPNAAVSFRKSNAAYFAGVTVLAGAVVELVDFLWRVGFLVWCFGVVVELVPVVEGVIVPASCARTGPATRAASTAVAARSFIERILKVLSMEWLVLARLGSSRQENKKACQKHGVNADSS